MLGICRALKHMVEGQGPEDGEKFVGYHFDLKPANILIFGVHTWQIADFGQSVFRAKTGSSMKLTNPGGTDEYAPPENADTDPEAKASSRYDVWSMGCILLELIAFLAMKGRPGIDELDSARDTSDEQRGDHRLWTKTSSGDIQLKPKIIVFMNELLKKSGPSERQFVGRILELTKRMLEPDVDKRFSASQVVETLKSIIETPQVPPDDEESLQSRGNATALAGSLQNVSHCELDIHDLSERRYTSHRTSLVTQLMELQVLSFRLA